MSRHNIGALVCWLGTFGLYLFTLAPTVQGFDSAELTVGAYTLGFVHPPGYPLYMLLGHLFAQIPIGNVGLRLNLMSAIFGGLTVLVLYVLMFEQTRRGLASLISTFLFATMPIFWSQAIRAEVYTFHTFLAVSALLAWWHAHHNQRITAYVLCFILLGIGMAHHPTTALLWVSVLICALWSSPRWQRISFGATVLGLGIAAVLYLYFPWRSAAVLRVDYIRPYFEVDPGSLSGLWWLISAQAFRCSFHLDLSLWVLGQEMSRLGILILQNALGIGLILGVWGWHHVRKTHPSWNRLLSIYFLANSMAFLAYHVVDKEVMFLPMYAVGNIWVANGIGKFSEWLVIVRRTNPHRTRILANGILFLVLAIGVWLNWSAVSLKDNHRVYDFSARLLSEVEPSTVIVNRWVTASVLDYLQVVEGKRPDVTSFNLDFYFLGLQKDCDAQNNLSAQQAWFAWLERQVGQRPLCFIEPLPPVPPNFHWIQQGACWKIRTAKEEVGGVQ